jgi:hypothetical protein
MEAHRVVRHQGSHISLTVCSKVVETMPVLRAGWLPFTPRRFLVLASVRGWVELRVIVQLEGWGQLKNPVTFLRIGPAIFQLVARCLNPTHSTTMCPHCEIFQLELDRILVLVGRDNIFIIIFLCDLSRICYQMCVESLCVRDCEEITPFQTTKEMKNLWESFKFKN